MATNVWVDPSLIGRALKVIGEPTKRAAVTRALEEFITRREQRGLLELFGKLEWDAGFEPRRERSREL
jgi:Arc/MetJ family transcription regulator